MTAAPWDYEAVSGTKVRLTNRTGAKAAMVSLREHESNKVVHSVSPVEPDASFEFKTSGGLVLHVEWRSIHPEGDHEAMWTFKT
ncbi:hypothetical protein CH306_22425 [Rhodococcus sp. 15-725-2-2b]|jgi:hypothetical protein|uniref:hypothetical protein n=1 Tax=unclassified Rhodococcus (in: high G+C Gram-positive bacteria) TaxID=192944 RepID=UPI000B9BECDD|nr:MULTISPECIES: hypothetical protein [unclassified Rhodococcus (in: high G+C Gram-positive bacteria)]OZC71666.1 hypothetical protein CH277_03860 [Rhodococcus sp. 06-469-3-2]OZD42455.1 hypothetical protein CH264_21275 [Rhodococcus sp. 06-1477-1A]OZE69798.1 hypothetical protein CH306_22425 [Rhodococcus sp. 15-725-2-2b]